MKRLLICLTLMVAVCGVAFSQEKPASNYDQHKAFDPLFYPTNGNEYRSAGGAPGPQYWQNRADYKITATLDTAKHRITGSVVVTYMNNSPEELKFLWLQLDQNIYREDSRAQSTTVLTGGRWANREFTQGDELKTVEVISNGVSSKAKYKVTDTRMQVWLAKPLTAKTGSVQIKMDYDFS